MRLRALLLVSASSVLLSVSTASADPITINLLSAMFTTRVATWTSFNAIPDTRESTSSAPLSDSLLAPGSVTPFSLRDSIGAIAETDIFRVHADTTSTSYPELGPIWSSLSMAKSELLFAPTATGLATIGLSLTKAGSNDFWSEGTVSLFDITANEFLWNHGWDVAAFPGNPLFGPPEYGHFLNGTPLNTGPLALDTAFDASHQYQLTLYTLTHSQNDTQNITLEVSGLHVVPEPSTLWLVGLGLIGFASLAGRTSRQQLARLDAVVTPRVGR
jgi:hypothetical protein